jgi:tRNA-dihydrouridine synthase
MKLLLAPIQGMTMAYYRNLYEEIFGGFDSYCAPFISTSNKKSASPILFRDLLKENNNKNIKVLPQILSNNGPDFRHYASMITSMGYNDINWNIGCPYATVTKKKKGSGILMYPDMVKEFLDEVTKDDSYNLTVKMRLGLNDLEEGIEIVKILNDYPLSGLIIHGRTGVQKYKGNVNLDSFETLSSLSKHEITYNGDIFTYDDFKNIQKRFPSIDKFMLGRGALRDPFLASKIKGIDIPNNIKIEKMKLFHDSVYNHYKNKLSGDQHLCDKMKEFWSYASVNLDPKGKFLKKIKKCHRCDKYMDIVNEMLDSSNIWLK